MINDLSRTWQEGDYVKASSEGVGHEGRMRAKKAGLVAIDCVNCGRTCVVDSAKG